MVFSVKKKMDSPSSSKSSAGGTEDGHSSQKNSMSPKKKAKLGNLSQLNGIFPRNRKVMKRHILSSCQISSASLNFLNSHHTHTHTAQSPTQRPRRTIKHKFISSSQISSQSHRSGSGQSSSPGSKSIKKCQSQLMQTGARSGQFLSAGPSSGSCNLHKPGPRGRRRLWAVRYEPVVITGDMDISTSICTYAHIPKI